MMFNIPSSADAAPTAAGWSSKAVLLEQVSAAAQHPSIGMDDSGDAIAVWTQWNTVTLVYDIHASRFSSGSWGPAMIIDDQSASAYYPQVVMDTNGNAMAAWLQGNGVWATSYSAGGWGTPRSVNADSYPVESFDLAIDNNGSAMVTWAQHNNNDPLGNVLIHASRFTAGMWSGDFTIENGVQDANSPAIAMDSHGNATVVWSQMNGSYNQIFFNRYSAAGWGTSYQIGSLDNGSIPQVGMDNNGGAMVVWMQFPDYRVYANHYAAGTWGDTVLLSTPNGAAGYPTLATDSKGNAIAMWSQSNATNDTIFTSRYSSGSWGNSMIFQVGHNYNCTIPDVAMDDQGNAFAVWQQNYGGSYRVMASRYSSGSWGTHLQIDLTNRSPEIPRIAMDSYGNAIAIWDQQYYMNLNMYARTYSAEPAVTISAPAQGSVVTSSTVLVTGTSVPGVDLNINGYSVGVSTTGTYSAVIPLLKGTNTITVTATSKAWGPTSSVSTSVTYNDQARADLNDTNVNVTKLQSDLNAASLQLNDTGQQLSDTKQQLNDVKNDLVPTLIGIVALLLAIVALLLVVMRKRKP
jgi:hypothetical protein